MGKKTIVKFVLDENDKNQIKQYSEKISKIFKLYGYNPKVDKLWDYFDDLGYYFGFIPCISEGYSECEDEEYDNFVEDAADALDDAYDPNVKLTLEDVEKYAKDEEHDTLENTVYERLASTNSECEATDWILANCDPITKQKFIDWVYK